MKTLILVRHAKSSWKDMTLRDKDRPLNKRGKRDAPFMGQKLKGLGIQPNMIWSSPAKRAFTTASHLADALGFLKEDIEIKNRIYGGSSTEIIDMIKDADASIQTLMVFGHNPEFTSIANQFSTTYIANVPTCGIIRVQFDIESWDELSKENAKVFSFIYPKMFI